MFGTWRLLLALEVVLAHLLRVHPLGANAVVSFFVLSGFLMTAIMQESYGYNAAGRLRFATNRALRLLPGYWFAAVMALLLIVLVGSENALTYQNVLAPPATVVEWFENLTILFVDYKPVDVAPRLVPPSWALTVEIVYYALICAGLSRTENRCRAWFLASLVLAVAMLAWGGYANALYGTILSGSLPFAAGSLAYHKRAAITAWLDRLRVGGAGWVVLRWFYLFQFYWVFKHYIPHGIAARELAMLGTIFVSVFVVVRLFSIDRKHRLGRFDEFLGAYSYPVYLLHFNAGLIAAALVYGLPFTDDYRDWPVFVVAMPILVLLSTVCVFAIDKQADRLRARNKASDRPAEAEPLQPGLAVAPGS
jgi:peptidoglycan/LPS O-acetylase OafA/YrhL